MVVSQGAAVDTLFLNTIIMPIIVGGRALVFSQWSLGLSDDCGGLLNKVGKTVHRFHIVKEFKHVLCE